MTSKVNLGFVIVGSFLFVSTSYGKVTYLHSNPTGSIVAATDEIGAQVWIKRYTPYGIEAGRNSIDEGANYGFASHENDSETGLVYMKARYYDPLVGRFYSTDPLNFQESKVISFNSYVYAGNNSLMFLDPDGRDLVFVGVDLSFLGFGGSIGVFATYPGGFSEPWDIGLFSSPTISQPGWLDALIPGPDPVGSMGITTDFLGKGFSTHSASIQFGGEYTRNHFDGVGVESCGYLYGAGACGSYNTLTDELEVDNLFSGASFMLGPQLGYDVSVNYTQTYSVGDAWSAYRGAVDSMFDSADWYSSGDYGSGGSYYGY